LHNICNDEWPFAGITIVLGGDFLQTLPVVPKASCEAIVDATIQQSHLWQHVKILYLRQNMHLDRGSADEQQFAQSILEVGHGQNMIHDTQICLPEHMRVSDVNSLIDSIYPGVNSNPPPPPEYFLNQMILAP
jgi:hypothetical protein